MGSNRGWIDYFNHLGGHTERTSKAIINTGIDLIKLIKNMTQNEALDILKLGYNLFLTGPPGNGKTFLLKKYINYLRKNNKQVAITAPTGIATTHMGGVTIHSWTGMGIKESISKNEMSKLLKKSYLRKRFENIGVLIIDEISMLHSYQFDLIDEICKAFKGNLKPFGGLQVVCSGDFL